MSNKQQDGLQRDWPESRQYKRSIRLEFSLYMSGMILLLMLATGQVITSRYVDTVTRSIAEKLLVQARAYSGPAGKLLFSWDGSDALLLTNICKKLEADSKDVYWVGISGRENTFLAHTDIKQVIAASSLTLSSSARYRDLMREGETFDFRGDTIQISVPIIENGVTVGRLGVASPADQISEARQSSILSIVSITVLITLLGIPLTMALMHRKLRPISIITDHLKAIDFDDIKLEIPISGRNELGYLAEILRVMGTKLNGAQREMIERERIARELEIAREIQANILPRSYPAGTRFTFAGTYRSAREVGGDYYDFIEYDDSRLGFLVADVSGKSLPGMLVMLLTRDIVRHYARTIHQPAQLLSAVNAELSKNIKKGMFVTMFYGVLDKETGHFTFASAGHNPLIRLKGDGGEPELIKTRGYPLGMMPSAQFDRRIESGELTLAPDDWLVQYTDGVNEAQNPAGEEFGMGRLVDMLVFNRDLEPEEFVRDSVGKHTAFVDTAPQFDDITLVTMKWMAGVPITTMTDY